MFENIITILSLICLMVICILSILTYIKNSKPVVQPKKETHYLTREELIEELDEVSLEIYTNKYEVIYKLKEIKVIPKMDEEIKNIANDIYAAFSDNYKESVKLYYSEAYFLEMIVRRTQAFVIQYTAENKPITK